MPASNALYEIGELEDALLHGIGLLVLCRLSGAPRDLCQIGIPETFGFGRERKRERCDIPDAAGEFRILDLVDPFREMDDETIDFPCQFGNVFLGRPDRRLEFEHDELNIGPSDSKLESARERRVASSASEFLLADWTDLPQACRMRCHACQSEILIAAGESIGFRDACDRCGGDLHVCLNCAHYDPTAYNECKESSAERILDRDRANRCDYFRPGVGRGEADDGRDDALSKLERLFRD